MGKYVVINEDTGEVVDRVKERKAIQKYDIEKLLSDERKMNEEEVKMLLAYLYQNEIVNRYYQFKVGGRFVDIDMIGEQAERLGKLLKHYIKLITLVSWNNMIKKTDTSVCDTFDEVMVVLNIRPNDRKEFKEFLMENDILRVSRGTRYDRVIFNPMINRKGSHVDHRAIITFYDKLKHNMCDISRRYLYEQGELNLSDTYI